MSFISPVLAQRLAALPAAMKTATDAKPYADEIKKFVTQQVAALKDDKQPNLQQRARDALAKESGSTGATPSASYLDVYATAVNDQFLTLADPKVPVRARLNAAIALHRIARNTNSAKLAPAATKLIADPCIAVALWAVKAAQPIIPAVAASGKPDKLFAAVVEAAKKYPDNGDLIDETYLGLTFNQKFDQVNEQTAAAILPDLLKFFQFRVEQYARTTPPRPELERRGINFLTLRSLWATREGAKQQPAIMQQMSNLSGLLGQHAAARNDTERREFVDTLKYLGDALAAVGGAGRLNDVALVGAGKKLTELQASMGETEYTDRATAAFTAIKARFPGTQPQPKMQDTAIRPPDAEIIVENPDEKDDPAAAAPAGGGDAPKDGLKQQGSGATLPPEGSATDRPAPRPAPAPAPAEKPADTPANKPAGNPAPADRPALQPPRDAARQP